MSLSLIDGYTRAAVVSKSDGTPLAFDCRAIYVGGTGNMEVITTGGDTVLFSAIPVGTIIPINARYVRSTNTTATLMVAMA